MWVPRSAVAQHGVEDQQEFAHRGGERELPGFAGSDQAELEGAQYGLMLNEREAAHLCCFTTGTGVEFRGQQNDQHGEIS